MHIRVRLSLKAVFHGQICLSLHSRFPLLHISVMTVLLEFWTF